MLRQDCAYNQVEPSTSRSPQVEFDVSYFKHICLGGFGRVIRDSLGVVVKKFSGLVSLSDSNGAEVYALLGWLP